MHNDLDQFYTKQEIVERVLKLVDVDSYDYIIEPSAGAGDFLRRLPANKSIGIDLEPAGPGIQKGDFFDFTCDRTSGVLTIGNPPFGKNSSLAVRFFNHAAEFSDCIAFIVPRTFRKASVINKLNLNFHLTEQLILPLESFYVPSGEAFAVPTVFQIWEKKNKKRNKIKMLKSHPDFDFLGSGDYNFSEIELNFVITGGHYGEKEKNAYIMTSAEYKHLQTMRKAYPKLFSAHRVVTAKKNLTWNTKPDFAWRWCGTRAGEVFTEYRDCPIEGFDFIKANKEGVIDIFIKMWDNIWNPKNNKKKESQKWDIAGQPSISKHELIENYIQTKKEIT